MLRGPKGIVCRTERTGRGWDTEKEWHEVDLGIFPGALLFTDATLIV